MLYGTSVSCSALTILSCRLQSEAGAADTTAGHGRGWHLPRLQRLQRHQQTALLQTRPLLRSSRCAALPRLHAVTALPVACVWLMLGGDLQAQLTDSLYGVDRGLTADTELRAEISELISSLEARNPTQAPNDVRTLQLCCNAAWPGVKR